MVIEFMIVVMLPCRGVCLCNYRVMYLLRIRTIHISHAEFIYTHISDMMCACAQVVCTSGDQK
jgi:hypothetical protein